MLKKELISHFGVSLSWLLVISFLRWYLKWGLICLWLGVLGGTFLLDIDHLIYWFFTHPEKEDSKIALELLKKKKFRDLVALMAEYHTTHTRLIFHTFLFQIIFLIFSFFIFTSSGSYFGSGLVAGMNLHLLKDEWGEILEKKEEHLNDWLFWQIRRKVFLGTQKIYLVIVSLIFGVLSLLV